MLLCPSIQHVLEEMTDPVVGRVLVPRTYPNMRGNDRAVRIWQRYGEELRAVFERALQGL